MKNFLKITMFFNVGSMERIYKIYEHEWEK